MNSLDQPATTERAESPRTAARQTRVLLFSCDGIYQRYLASRLGSECDLVGVVIHDPPHAKGRLSTRLLRYIHPMRLSEYVQARVLNKAEKHKAAVLENELFYVDGREPQIPGGVDVIRVPDINCQAAVDFARQLAPDVICVNGTNLLRAPMLGLEPSLKHGIINLHTGLSPYSRGGNCNLFMLLEGHPELVGVTVHYIDQGIDSGEIIVTARPDMQPGDNFFQIEAKAFRLGIDLMLVSVHQAAAGNSPREKQWTAGKLFLRRTGYCYKPYHIVQVDRLLRRGLLGDYLHQQSERNRAVRLVQPFGLGETGLASPNARGTGQGREESHGAGQTIA